MNFVNYRFEIPDTFKRQLFRLARKYRNIADDFERFLLDFDLGRVRGDAIRGFGGKIFKARMKSSDIRKGKRGGYRVIYYLKHSERLVYMLAIYAKVEREDIAVEEIRDILEELGL